ncbi:SRPBCC family protein [Compostimonas suwonensis]|uniref:Polyketide cyclase/dehydrase/lipid transport protein n=1 Tax=Compostimonas suwonensis TaxID=1048394 RepID=A0A2M9C3F5_9MICO|nr:SRPBCC family protein [Compostimonas suwonensis]PJJ65073.1 polyketide cyclase/dehydrase/lipid transport protein [Compostimonas suwonensis]
MGTVRSEIDVNAPISTVYNQWTQFESFPRFMGGVDEVVQHGDHDTHWTVKIAGVEREFDATITEQTPDERIAWKSTDGETHAGVVTFHRLDDESTRIRLEIEWKPQGFVEKAGEVLQIDDIQIDRDLEDFKHLIESNGSESGAWRGEIPREPDATGR